MTKSAVFCHMPTNLAKQNCADALAIISIWSGGANIPTPTKTLMSVTTTSTDAKISATGTTNICVMCFSLVSCGLLIAVA